MPVGSHKDAFKAHQLVKKVIKKNPSSVLGKIAADILLDFVKNQRQVTSDSALDALPVEAVEYDSDQLDKALLAVDSLCGKCDDAHDDSCFVNQARRVLIAARTGVDLGSTFDGTKSLADLLDKAKEQSSVKVDVSDNIEDEQATNENPSISEDKLSELEALKEQDVFRGTLIDEVVETIQSVTEGNYAADMPVHEDEQLGKLAKAFNLMLSTIKTSMAELDTLVEERTAELKQIMNTVPIGLLSINSDGKIKPEHSRAATKILNQDVIKGRDYLDLLGITKRREKDRSVMIEYFDLVRMGLLSDDDLAPLNSFPELELSSETDNKWLRLRYSSVKRNDEATGDVLVELKDITEEKRLAAEVDASQKENLKLKVIAEDPDVFREFLGEVLSIQKQVRECLNALSDNDNWVEIINDMFRGVHTIKGAAGSFGLTDLADSAGVLENELSIARSADQLKDDFVDGISLSLTKLDSIIEDACQMASTILGDDISTEGASVRVPLSELKSIEVMLTERKDPALLLNILQKMQQVPAFKALSRSVKIVPSLISRLGKSIDFIFEGKDVLVDFEEGHAINNPLVHLLRNACDHGIESTEDRIKAGKPEQAKVTLSVEVESNKIIVTVRDDGKGMDADKIAQSALNKGVISKGEANSLSTDDKLLLIFKPGFSTAAAVTDVSGRGVGLDVVKESIENDLGGTIAVNSELTKGSSFILTVPC